MKPSSRWFVFCALLSSEDRDFVVHAHRRPWRRKIGLVMALGPDGTTVIIPDEILDDDDAFSAVLGARSYVELMSVLRRHDAYDEEIHNTWRWRPEVNEL